MKDLILKYGILHGKRYSNYHKINFIEEYIKDFSELGYEVKKQFIKRRFFNSVNLFFGDIESAKIILIAAYDTSVGQIIKKGYYPFNPKLNYQISIQNMVLTSIIGVIALLLSGLILYNSLNFIGYSKFLMMAISMALFGISMVFFNGFKNKINYSRNSMSLVMMLKIAKAMKFRTDIGFLAIDRGVRSIEGYKFVSDSFASKNKQFIILDGLSDGCNVFVSSANPSLSKQIIDCIPTSKAVDLSISTDRFPMIPSLIKNSVQISIGESYENEVFVKASYSQSDYRFNEILFNEVYQGIIRYVQS